MEVQVTRMYTGIDNESHFEDITIPLKDEEGFFQWSDPVFATGVIFGELYNTEQHDWQRTPHRQFLITISGAIEMEVGDKTKRIFKSGDILLAEDTTGRGHRRRLLGNENHKTIIITLD